MSQNLQAFENKTETNASWLFELGTREFLPAGATLLREGVRPNAIYLVITGELSVTVAGPHDDPLASLRAGELIGEMAFLEGSGASATVVAERDSVVLKIDYAPLEQKLQTDSDFASQLYRAFALTAERRLRRRVDSLLVANRHAGRGDLMEARLAY